MSLECPIFIVAVLTLAVAIWTVLYMYSHDAKADWVEIHKAMMTVRVARNAGISKRSAMGAYGVGPNAFDERKNEFETAVVQLRGQLARRDDEPLTANIRTLLDQNMQPSDPNKWLSDEFGKAFDKLAEEVAAKAR